MLRETVIGFDICVPKYSPTACMSFTWVEHDVSESALALLKSYTDPAKNVLGKSYPVVTASMTYPNLAAVISKGKI
jgi:hypothetical protein